MLKTVEEHLELALRLNAIVMIRQEFRVSRQYQQFGRLPLYFVPKQLIISTCLISLRRIS